jgi:uncharacterized protein (TIGR02246 family)
MVFPTTKGAAMSASMSDDERAIRALIDTWMAASVAGDTAKVLSLMADDVVFLTAGQKPFGKAEFAANASELQNVRIEGKSEIQEIEVAGSWAWCRNQLTVVMTPPDGKPARRSGPVLTIFRKNPDGRWMLARDANLLTPEG